MVFDKAGGYIEYEAAKTRAQNKREDDVYWMKVKLADVLPVFQRPGRWARIGKPTIL